MLRAVVFNPSLLGHQTVCIFAPFVCTESWAGENMLCLKAQRTDLKATALDIQYDSQDKYAFNVNLKSPVCLHS